LSNCSSQLNGWYNKDDVVAEWKKVKDEMCLHVHCYVSGPNPLLDLAAEFRYHIFSKELPLVSLNSILFLPAISHLKLKGLRLNRTHLLVTFDMDGNPQQLTAQIALSTAICATICCGSQSIWHYNQMRGKCNGTLAELICLATVS